MEIGSKLLSSSPPFLPRTHLRHSSSSVPILNEQAAPAVTSMPTVSLARHFPASVLLLEQRDEFRPFLYTIKEDKTSLATMDRNMTSFGEEKKICESDKYLKDFECQLVHWTGLWYLWPSLYTQKNSLLSLTMQPKATDTDKLVDVRPCDVLALAKKAVLASKQVVSLVEDSKLFGTDSDDSVFPGLGAIGSANLIQLKEKVTVRSTRLLERRSKKRRGPKPNDVVHEVYSLRKEDIKGKINESYDPNDPLRLFLRSPETKQLLTAKEELELFGQMQELIKLEEVKRRFQSQFDREPTLVEWAEAVGMSCRVLQSHLHSGNNSREKMIYANFRMVVHVAKLYQGRGLNLQDLLQEGSMGLMRSLEKFKPQVGCRFSTYAYWWIRQRIRKAIYQNSRTIRLPENVYNLLRKVKSTKELYSREGHRPTNEELAKHVGITVEKLETLLSSTRMPLSIQQPVWLDQSTTFQEITADTEIESTDLCVSKQMMRRHVHNLLRTLSPRERRIIRLRYGIEDGKPKSLAEIGSVFRLSKERIRQLENRALNKLKQCLSSHGLGAYSDLLI